MDLNMLEEGGINVIDGRVPCLGESIYKITLSKLVFYITHKYGEIVMWGAWRFQGEWS